MIVELDYGRGTLPVEMPPGADVTVIRKASVPPLAAPAEAVRDALAQPVGGPPLVEVARGRKTACILICDITRPVPNGLILPILVRELLDAGLAPEAITVLVANGLHRANEGTELEELVGDRWVLDTVQVVNHDARNAGDHLDLGFTTTRGTPVKLDRRFVEADVRIATGLVEPHFMAGYSGGRKVVAPGVAHEETIRTFHSARFMEDSGAIQCNLDGNPLHEEQLEIIGMLGGDVQAINVVLDEHRRLVHVNFGEVIESHLAAVEFVRGSSSVALPRRFKTVVTSAAGYPLDKTYYQTVKGMVTPIDILSPGASLLIASECSEGMGSEHFRGAQQRLLELGPEAFLEGISGKRLADIDEWQTEMQLKPMRVASIHLYAGKLPPADHALTGVNVVASMDDAVRASIESSGDPAVAVIPEGPYVVPYYAGN